MSYTIKLTRSSHTDIKEAQSWYEEQKAGLGASFYEAVKERINFLSDNPYTYPSKYTNIRHGIVTGYPYTVHYLIEEEKKQVIVLGVLHMSRNPKTWQERKK